MTTVAERPTTAAAPAAKPAAPAPEVHVHWVGPLLVLITGMFMTVLDTSIVNVAVPTIQTEFGGSTAEIAWISTAYSLVLGVVVPTTAWLGDRFGLARLYNVALIGFALGSALCGIAWSLPSLIAFRVLQAVPGGILPAITMTMVYRLVPKDKIGAAMGMYGIGVIAAPALGPTLGGYLVEYVDWRLIFYINVPVAIVGVLLSLRMLPRFSQLPTYPFDFLGFVAVAGGLVALLLAFSQGSSWGWTSYPILGLMIGGALLLALFVVIDLEVEYPLLNLSVFKNWPYVNSLLIMCVQTVGMFATLFYIPVFLQSALGMPALQAGLLVLPQALLMGVITPIAGRLYDKLGPRWLVFTGMLIATAGGELMTRISMDTTQGEIILWTCVRSFGVGLSMMSVMASGIAALDHTLTNSGSAINNVVQRVGAALGLAGLSAMVTVTQAQLAADRNGLLTSANPDAAHMGILGLYQVARTTNLQVLATSMANMFQVTSWLTMIGAVLALFLRSGPVKVAAGAPPMAALD